RCVHTALFRVFFFFFQAEDGIRDFHVTGVQTCALPISRNSPHGLERGNRFLSNSATRRPARPRKMARAAPAGPPPAIATSQALRSEERRVGKECRCRW